jgi:hypothetical protein
MDAGCDARDRKSRKSSGKRAYSIKKGAKFIENIPSRILLVDATPQ